MVITRNLIALFTIFLFCFAAFCTRIYADTHLATSCSYSDVVAAYNAASAGDTVSIPACPAGVTWTSTLNITKPITLQGTGYLDGNGVYQTGTYIKSTTGTIVYVNNSAGGVDPVRITGIRFDRVTNSSSGTKAVVVYGGEASTGKKITQFRMDNCRFDWGNYAATEFTQIVFGVINSNYYYNGQKPVRVYGPGSETWNNYTYDPGTANMLFFEDNVFYWDASGAAYDGIFYDINSGARMVVRYNSFDSSTCTTCWSHGILHIYRRWGLEYRGAMLVECYGNTANMYTIQNFFGWRGGSLLLYNNNVSTAHIDQNFARAEEQDVYDPYPLQDEVNNSFIWNNTMNGSPTSDVYNNSYNQRIGIQGQGTPAHIEVWLQAPSASGGRNVYPTSLGGTDMYFTSEGPNAYYPYTPYAYPHPLRNEVGPNPPTGLKIIP